MSETSSYDQEPVFDLRYTSMDLGLLERDFIKVGEYLRQAILETASNVGGGEYADKIESLIGGMEEFPNPKALEQLDNDYPGSAEIAMERWKAIQEDARAKEMAELQRDTNLGSPKNLGRAILRGLRSFRF